MAAVAVPATPPVAVRTPVTPSVPPIVMLLPVGSVSAVPVKLNVVAPLTVPPVNDPLLGVTHAAAVELLAVNT